MINTLKHGDHSILVRLSNRELTSGSCSAHEIRNEFRARLARWFANRAGWKGNKGGWIINGGGKAVAQGYTSLYEHIARSGALEAELRRYEQESR